MMRTTVKTIETARASTRNIDSLVHQLYIDERINEEEYYELCENIRKLNRFAGVVEADLIAEEN